jgi:hypothetical protein
MGCFSYMCKECNRPIRSDGKHGDRVRLFLLVDGKMKEEMVGEYDSYGRVFKAGPRVEGRIHPSIEWQMDWGQIVDLHFGDDKSSGIAAVHEKCFSGIPTTRSEDDPDQGLGSDFWRVEL